MNPKGKQDGEIKPKKTIYGILSIQIVVCEWYLCQKNSKSYAEYEFFEGLAKAFSNLQTLRFSILY
ncbi:hypothetical protein BWI93_24455 [Siphonobacter sp. BAB-5385]|nr:hypothetical protein BWI93_24455 [Siphonobacter sp. BAB-5385]